MNEDILGCETAIALLTSAPRTRTDARNQALAAEAQAQRLAAEEAERKARTDARNQALAAEAQAQRLAAEEAERKGDPAPAFVSADSAAPTQDTSHNC